MRPKLLWIICGIVCFIINYGNTSEKLNVDDKRQTIDSLLTELLGCRGGRSFSGVALSVVHNGRVLMARGYGKTNFGGDKAVTEKTLFGIGPITQTFTSTLLAKLFHKHPRFNLRTPISKVIPKKFKFHDTLRTTEANCEDLLGQRMGLVRHNYMAFQDQLTRKRLAFKMQYMRRASKFRDSYINSDIMYSLAAYVTEQLSNQTWEELVTRELFRPIKMSKSTFFTDPSLENRNLATAYYPHNYSPRKLSVGYFREATKLGGAQSILSNAADMGKWMLFHLSDGRNKKGRSVVPPEALRDTYTPLKGPSRSPRSFRKSTIPEMGIEDGVALGWTNGSYRGYQMLSSTRSTRSLMKGYLAKMSLFPSEGLGLFTVFNGNQLNYQGQAALHAAIAGVVLDEDVGLNSSTVCSFSAPWLNAPSEVKKPSAPNRVISTNQYKSYTGVYYNSIYGRIVVFHNKLIGRLQMQYGPIKSDLQPLSSRNVFQASGSKDFWLFKVTVTFQTNPRKPTVLSIPEFVPNYPTNPIRFKLTKTKIPDKYLVTAMLNKTTMIPSLLQTTSPTQGGDEDHRTTNAKTVSKYNTSTILGRTTVSGIEQNPLGKGTTVISTQSSRSPVAEEGATATGTGRVKTSANWQTTESGLSLNSTLTIPETFPLRTTGKHISETTTYKPSTLEEKAPFTIESKLFTTESALSTNQSELSTTESAVSTTQSELSMTESPLFTTQSALSMTQSALSRTQSALSTTQLPLSTTQLPLSTTHLPLSTTHLPLSTTHLPLSTTQSSIVISKCADEGCVEDVTHVSKSTGETLNDATVSPKEILVTKDYLSALPTSSSEALDVDTNTFYYKISEAKTTTVTVKEDEVIKTRRRPNQPNSAVAFRVSIFPVCLTNLVLYYTVRQRET